MDVGPKRVDPEVKRFGPIGQTEFVPIELLNKSLTIRSTACEGGRGQP
jgi:hypothetical protein